MNLLTLNGQQATAALADPSSDREMEPFHRHQGMVGIRPEHVFIGDTGLPARIVAADYLGSETIVRIRLDDQVLFARTGKRIPPGPEAQVHVSWPRESVCLFDITGRRLPEDVL
jgi:ABC-type sugar transport system ATPase subunit